jgi:sodium pump decarboxylase gamma subunit
MKIGDALYVTVIGMGTVLVALLIVALVINIVKKFIDQKEKSNFPAKVNGNSQVNKETISKIESNTEEQEDNRKIVASIAASLYIMLNQSNADQLVIKKITRINQYSTEWAKAGRRDQIKSLNKL